MTQFKLCSGEEVSYDRSGFIQIEVTDTGIGMSHDQVSRLFQAGIQFNVNELQSGQGSGLGLYISKGIVEQHGGTMEVSSGGIGHGTTFTCYLPLYRVFANIEDETSRTRAFSNATAVSKMIVPLRILIVDDTREKVCRNYGNAIYVTEFIGSNTDEELPQLARYLIHLRSEPNFRRIEKRGWRNKQIPNIHE